MDYGYQLLRHVVQQVFGNIAQAARMTLLLFIVPWIGFVWLGAGAMTGAAAQDPSALGGSVFGALMLLIAAVIAYCWAAVGWHRYVLLEEMGSGVTPQWHWDRIKAYLGRAFLVGFAVVGAVVAAGLVVALAVGLTQSAGIAILLGIGLVLGASWVATRIGLVLPAAAIGERMTLSESWAATRPVSSQILLPLVVVALVVGIVGQIIVFLFGQTVTVEVFGTPQEQLVLSLPGQILNGFVSWVQILVNLALMTTLYGNLIEGRQLN
jgi:hypothetical protein